MKLVLPPHLRARIEDQARGAFPRECCGLVEGRRHGGFAEAIALHAAHNIAERDDQFEIHPEYHLALLRQARGNGRAIIGCYHSHPNGSPVPSEMDRVSAGEEDFLWLIAALEHGDGPAGLAAFVYSGGGFFSVDLEGPRGADLVTSSE